MKLDRHGRYPHGYQNWRAIRAGSLTVLIQRSKFLVLIVRDNTIIYRWPASRNTEDQQPQTPN